MKIGFILFEGFSLPEFSLIYGVFDKVRELHIDESIQTRTVSFTLLSSDRGGLSFRPDRVGGDLSSFDALVLPGGAKALSGCTDEAFRFWLSSGFNVPLRIMSGEGVALGVMSGWAKDRFVSSRPPFPEGMSTYCKAISTDPVTQDAGCFSCIGGLHALSCAFEAIRFLYGDRELEAVRASIYKE